jgi:hypothetical protein
VRDFIDRHLFLDIAKRQTWVIDTGRSAIASPASTILMLSDILPRGDLFLFYEVLLLIFFIERGWVQVFQVYQTILAWHWSNGVIRFSRLVLVQCVPPIAIPVRPVGVDSYLVAEFLQ